MTLTFCTGAAFVLDVVVSRLDDHPGTGWPLIRAALSNEAIRNRIMALKALLDFRTSVRPVGAHVRRWVGGYEPQSAGLGCISSHSLKIVDALVNAGHPRPAWGPGSANGPATRRS